MMINRPKLNRARAKTLISVRAASSRIMRKTPLSFANQIDFWAKSIKRQYQVGDYVVRSKRLPQLFRMTVTVQPSAGAASIIDPNIANSTKLA